MNIDGNFTSIAATFGGGFFGGLLLGYAIKKVIRIAAVIVGLFVAGLVYLQYQQIASINWDGLESTITTIANITAGSIQDSASVGTFSVIDFGIPLTSSMSSGFSIGFLKG